MADNITLDGNPNASLPLTGAEKLPVIQSNSDRTVTTQNIADLSSAAALLKVNSLSDLPLNRITRLDARKNLGLEVFSNIYGPVDDITITNPLSSFNGFSFAVPGKKLFLPTFHDLSDPNVFVKGRTFIIANIGGEAFDVYASDTTTLMISGLELGQWAFCTVVSNGILTGNLQILTVEDIGITFPVSVDRGGTGATVPYDARLNLGLNYDSNQVSSATDITLTNPLQNLSVITFSTSGRNLILPPFNDVDALVKGRGFVIINEGVQPFDVYASDTTTLILSGLQSGEWGLFKVLTNSNLTGDLQSIILSDSHAGLVTIKHISGNYLLLPEDDNVVLSCQGTTDITASTIGTYNAGFQVTIKHDTNDEVDTVTFTPTPNDQVDYFQYLILAKNQGVTLTADVVMGNWETTSAAGGGQNYSVITNANAGVYTLTGSENKGFIVFPNNANPKTLTLPTTAQTNIRKGFSVTVLNPGTGELTIVSADIIEGSTLIGGGENADIVKRTIGGPNIWNVTSTGFSGNPLLRENNLSDLISRETARNNININLGKLTYLAQTSDLNLASPFVILQNQLAVQFNSPGLKVVLPAMNVAGSQNFPFTIVNFAGQVFDVYAQDGITPIVTGINSGDVYDFYVTDYSTANGSFDVYQRATIDIVELLGHKDFLNGYVGLTNYNVDIVDTTGNFTSYLTNSNTASRTYTLPDQSGIVVINATLGDSALLKVNNLSDLTDFSTARLNLGLNVSVNTIVDVLELTNPLDSFIKVTITSTGKQLKLPDFTEPNAFLAGRSFIVYNYIGETFDIISADGSTVLIAQLSDGQFAICNVTDNGDISGGIGVTSYVTEDLSLIQELIVSTTVNTIIANIGNIDTNPSGIIQGWFADLDAIATAALLGGKGILARNTDFTWTLIENVAADNSIEVENGNGASGNPTYKVLQGNLVLAESQITNLTSDLTARELTANKNASGGYAGLTLLKINFKNAANTVTSFFTNTNTVARTYTFQDRNGTIADDTDLSTKVTKTGDIGMSGIFAITSADVTLTNTGNFSTTPLIFTNASTGVNAGLFGDFRLMNSAPSLVTSLLTDTKLSVKTPGSEESYWAINTLDGGSLTECIRFKKSGTFFPTSGGTASNLNYYEEGTHTTNWQGIWASAQAGNVKFTRIGNMVTLVFPTVIATQNTSSIITMSTVLPARLRPSGNVFIPIKVTDITDFLGDLLVDSSGNIKIYSSITDTNFSGVSGNAGFYGTSITYTIA